eukprot:8672946-Heterocapsa_arctica.AAC.1
MTGRRTGRKAGPLGSGRKLPGSGRLPGTGRSGPGSRCPGSEGPPESVCFASGWELEESKNWLMNGGRWTPPGKAGATQRR